MKRIYTENAPVAIGPYSQGCICNGFFFTSGQIPLDSATGAVVGGNVTTQSEQVMQNLSALLEAAGASFTNVVKTTCFLANMSDFVAFNEIYGRYFTENPLAPALRSKPCHRMYWWR